MTEARGVCAEAASGLLPEEDRNALLADRSLCLSVSAGLTAGPVDIGTQLVQTVAQVVVTKAQQAGWELLLERLRTAAHCADVDRSRFPNTCKLLGSLSIKDLVASPASLLSATITDLLGQVKVKNGSLNQVLVKQAPTIGALVLMADGRWLQKNAAVSAGLRRVLQDLVNQNAKTTCNATTPPVQQYAVVAGLCLIQNANDLAKCDSSKQFAFCPGADPETAKRLWDLTVAAGARSAGATDWIDLIFAIGEEQVKEIPAEKWAGADRAKAIAYLNDLHDLLAGVTSSNWVRATAGGVALLDAIAASIADEKEKGAEREAVKLISLLAAIGNYALTYDPAQKLDAAAAAAAREKIMTELVDRMVNRTDREGGAVISLGGNLGVFGGVRLGSNGSGGTSAAWAFPVQLGLGVGLQTYGRKNAAPRGIHAQFSVLDLGQYVNFSGQGLQVSTPKVESSVVLQGTFGGWFALRETPVYYGVCGSIAPFVQAAGKTTYQVGAVLGIYVPLLDFN